MRSGSTGWFIIAMIGLTAGPAHAGGPPPVEAFSRLPDLESVRISPDGKSLGWIGDDRGRRAVHVLDVDSGKLLKPITTENEYKFRAIEWADDRTLLVTISFSRTLDRESVYRTTDEFHRFMAFDTANGNMTILLADLEGQEQVRSSTLLRPRAATAKGALLASWSRRVTANCAEPFASSSVGVLRDGAVVCWQYALLDVDLKSGRGDILETGDRRTSQWFVGGDGRILARFEWTGFVNGYRIYVPANRGWSVAQEVPDYLELRPAGPLADEKALLGIGPRGGNRVLAWRMPIDGGDVALLYEGEEDVESEIEDIHTGTVVGLRLGGIHQPVHWLDKRMAEIQAAAERAFPGKRVAIESRSANFRRVVVRVESSGHAPAYFLIDFDRGTADSIGEAYPELAGIRMGETRTISFRTSDGRTIPGYLTLPPDRAAKELPLVVLLHDGLPGRDAPVFDWRVQFIASRGYVVLQPQYRGSLGFGVDHGRAGRGQWGHAVQNDVTDGITHLREQQLADASRVCVVGEGYGGYLALASAAKTPELFSCVAGINAITDLPSMFDHLERLETLGTEYWKDRIGPPRAYELFETSPIRSTRAILTPVMLVSSTEDSVVPLTQTDKLARALLNASKPHEIVKLEGEDHWLSQGSSRQRLLEALETFLAENLGAPAR